MLVTHRACRSTTSTPTSNGSGRSTTAAANAAYTEVVHPDELTRRGRRRRVRAGRAARRPRPRRRRGRPPPDLARDARAASAAPRPCRTVSPKRADAVSHGGQEASGVDDVLGLGLHLRRGGRGRGTTRRRSCRRPRCPTGGPRTRPTPWTPSARRSRAPLPGAVVSFAVIGSPATDVAVTSDGRQLGQLGLLLAVRRGVDPGVRRVAVPLDQLGVELARASCR